MINSFFKWLTIISCVLGCGIVYSGMFLAYFGTTADIAHNHVATFVSKLTGLEQLALFVLTPFVSAFLGGCIVGFILMCLVEAILSSLGRLFGCHR